MRKKLSVIAIVIVSALLLGMLSLVFVACDKKNISDATYQYDITVWVGENTDTLTKNLIDQFNETNDLDVYFNARIEVVSESKAAGNAISTPESCADIFCFAQDQLARLVHSKLLAKLNSSAVKTITDDNDEASVAAATIGDQVWAFPLTHDNGYFLYYDKDVIPDEHASSLNQIIEDCKNKSKNISMSLAEDGSWYAASFFYATGCKSEWKTDSDGNFISYEDDFYSDKGVAALKGMQLLFDSKRHKESSEVSTFKAGVPSAAVISGIWNYKAAKTLLGDKLGIAPLPSFTVDGQTYDMVTYMGTKLMGVKPQSDPIKLYFLQQLAAYLTNEQAQMARFNAVGWGPSNKVAAASDAVKNDPALHTLYSSKSTEQGQYPTNWWKKVEVMVGNAKTSSADALMGLLDTYSSSLNGLMAEG